MTTEERMKKIVEVALKEVGTTEAPPNSNKNKYGAWYGLNGVAWCAEFVSWVYNEAGSPLGKVDDEKGYRYCPSAYLFWKNHNQLTKTPQPGDIVLFDWNGDGKSDHTGIFYKDNGNGKTFQSIEGNTAFGNDSNGGKVMIRTDRNYGAVRAFVHPAVLGESVITADTSHDLKKGDKGGAVSELQQKLIQLKYTITVVDGDFGTETGRAVKAFQKENKFTVNGIVTPHLMEVIDLKLKPAPVTDVKITDGAFLKKGDKGINVILLQKALNKNGAKINEDGDYGDETKKAISVFQKKNKLKIDGVAGPETLSALKVKL